MVWQTFSLCTFTSCLVDILSQALLAKQQQEEEGADVAFIQASMPYMKAGGAVVCTVGPFKVAASQGLLSLFCELLLCSLAQQSAGNAIVYIQ